MSGPTSNDRRATGAFTVTVAGEPRFIETIRLLTHKTAEADGCTARDADRLADAVRCVLDAYLGPNHASGRVLDVRFDPSPDTLQVEIGVPNGGGGASPRSVEAQLAQLGLLGSLKALVPDVQFIRKGGHDLCRFRCPRRAPDR